MNGKQTLLEESPDPVMGVFFPIRFLSLSMHSFSVFLALLKDSRDPVTILKPFTIPVSGA